MLVTILTDASHCPETKSAGYGYWIVSDRGHIKGGAEFKSTVKNIGHAEIMAIINALYCAIQAGIAQKGDTILVQSDSTLALNILKYRSKKEEYGYLIKEWRRLTGKMGNVVYRHVKAHSGAQDARSYANRYCDKIARISMRRMRESTPEPQPTPA